MSRKIIYLAGGMSGLTFEEYNNWRAKIKDRLSSINSNWKCFNPAEHFDFNDVARGIITDREAMEIDLNKLRHSDIMIMNFNRPASLGSQAELGIAYELRIPTIGINEENNLLHPWQYAMCTKIFNQIDDAVQFAIEHYLED